MMLPPLPESRHTSKDTSALLAALTQAGFRGDTSTRAKDRLAVATDNSVYQCLPEAVIWPTETQDLLKLLRLLAKPEFRDITLTPRGGGTGTNGQSLTPGIMVDLSRYMNAILEINPHEGWARVQPGVVLDELNRALEPHKLRFAPDLSPSNRATLGGMIGTDASGKGSRVYGKTSQHIIALDLALADGTHFCSETAPAQKNTYLASLPPRARQLYEDLVSSLVPHASDIRKAYPKLKRFLTGYNLPHFLPQDPTETANLNALICGSEGTLAFVTEAKLKLVPQVSHKALWVLTYETFDDALRAAQDLVAIEPGAIETIDDTILALARKDSIWTQVQPILEAFPQEDVAAINLVELWAHSQDELDKKIRIFQTKLETTPSIAKAYLRAQDEQSAEHLWSLRKKGVGLLGAQPGERRPVAFVEDSVVPPERLADYIAEFRAILDREGLRYGMFGHVDVGCLHVRPALNLRLEKDRAAMRRISNEVQALAARYGGVLWGEHGRGYRSAYTPEFFGDTVYGIFRAVKSLFDPHNQLNPGKIATSKTSQSALVSVNALTRGHKDQNIAPVSLEHYAPIINCNGNAACMNVLPEGLMCPSAQVTKDRVHSPKGRATMMREWLARLGEQGFDPANRAAHRLEKQTIRWFRNPKKTSPDRDFSLEVYDAMNGCLACKACTTQCPIAVDIPTVRSEFLSHFHTRYRRPLRDHLVGLMETGSIWFAKAPQLSSLILHNSLSKRMMHLWGGLVDLPTYSTNTVAKILKAQGQKIWSTDNLVASPPKDKPCVVLVQDPVTSFFDTQVFDATLRAIAAMGVEVRVLSFKEHGKGFHVKGMLGRFENVARIQASRLRALDQVGYTLVGIDPAYTLAYQDDYHQVLPEGARPPRVWMIQSWMHTQLKTRPLRLAKDAPRFTLFGHCTERSLTNHSEREWSELFQAKGFALEHAAVGCCGMGGVFGHQREHLDQSRGIFERSWKPALDRVPGRKGIAVATGFSCRSQSKRFGGQRLPHPIEFLAPNSATKTVSRA